MSEVGVSEVGNIAAAREKCCEAAIMQLRCRARSTVWGKVQRWCLVPGLALVLVLADAVPVSRGPTTLAT